MPLAYNQYTGDGSTRVFGISFPYIAKSHVKVRLNGEAKPFTWVTTASIQLSEAPAPGVVIDVRRETPNAAPMIDYSDGSTMVESDLDLSAIQSLYIAQEVVDALSDKLGTDTDGEINALSRRIKNVAAPEQPLDAANRAYVDATVASVPPLVVAAQGSADTAAAQAQIATSAAETATNKAVAAAASAALAATFDPTLYYLKTAFKADATASAPVKYGTIGELVGRKLITSGSASSQQRIEFQNSGNAKWTLLRDTDETFRIINEALGAEALSFDKVTNKANFAQTPLIGGIPLASLLGGLKTARLITTSGNVQPSAGVTKWLGFLVGGGGTPNGMTSGAGGAGCAFLASVTDATLYALIVGGVGGNSSLVIGGATFIANGNGGTASGGFLNLPGQPGQIGSYGQTNDGVASFGLSGSGGDGPFGLGRGGPGHLIQGYSYGNGLTWNGNPGIGYGAGGGGNTHSKGGGAGVDGAGTPGCLLIVEF